MAGPCRIGLDYLVVQKETLKTMKIPAILPCLCGIPDCLGHEDMGGFIVLSPLEAQLLLEVEASESSQPSPREES